MGVRTFDSCKDIPAYPENPSICVVRTLEEYVARTEKERKASQLLLSYIRPYVPISSQTLSRWLKNCLVLAGIDNCFTGHSTRSAATSSAAEAGLSLETILEAADWSSVRTFERFCRKPPVKGDFARAVLGNTSS